MNRIPGSTPKRNPAILKKAAPDIIDGMLHQQAFENSLLPNILSTVSTGQIIAANVAACKLLGYSKKELLTKTRSLIFDINESSFKKMLKRRTAEGHAVASLTAIKKSGKRVPCEITSAVFLDEKGIQKAITTIADSSELIHKQRDIDILKEKKVADNIIIARSKQKGIDIKNKRKVAQDIGIARTKQKNIDTKNEKIVADNIVLAQEKSDARLAVNNEWIKYIATTSYDVMWDWDIASGTIYVGDSIREVFGYNVIANTVKITDFDRCLLPAEQDSVREKLKQALSSRRKTWTDSFMFMRKDGSLAATVSRASIVRDDKGKAIRLIGAIQDVSLVQDLEKKLEDQTNMKEEQRDKFRMAINLSIDIIWDWNLLTQEIFISENLKEVFGHEVQNNKVDFTTWSRFIHPDDRETVEKNLYNAIASSTTYWEQPYRYIKADGSIVNVFGRGSIMRYQDGKAFRMIGAIHDLSRQRELEEKLDKEIAINTKQSTEYKESFKLIFNSSSDVLYDIDLGTFKVIISDGYEKEFGYKTRPDMTPEEIWLNHVHPDDKKALINDYFRMIKSEEMEWKYKFRLIKADQSIATILGSNIILRKAGGKAYRMIGSMNDVSKQKVLEEKLELEIRLKGKQIEEAMEDAKSTERSDIGKELHDNVNQLLGASNLYLDMAKRGGKLSEMYLSRSSEYSRKAIEEIRKLTKGLTTDTIRNLGLSEAIDNIVHDTMEMNAVKITFTMEEAIENRVNDKFKLNIFRIVQEELNNILKHAKATKVHINLSQNKKSIVLIVSDNGVGFDTNIKRKGIGLDNIKSRAATFKGRAEFISQPGHGCVLTVTFRISELLLKET